MKGDFTGSWKRKKKAADKAGSWFKRMQDYYNQEAVFV